MTGGVDAIVLELIETRLTSVVREMRSIMIRTARSPMIHEGHDFYGDEIAPSALPGKVTAFGLRANDVVIEESAGGGGYGDPLGRDPAAVSRDVAYGYISPAGGLRRSGDGGHDGRSERRPGGAPQPRRSLAARVVASRRRAARGGCCRRRIGARDSRARRRRRGGAAVPRRRGRVRWTRGGARSRGPSSAWTSGGRSPTWCCSIRIAARSRCARFRPRRRISRAEWSADWNGWCRRYPGNLSALGLLASDQIHERVRTFLGRLDSMDLHALAAARDDHAAEGRAELARRGFAGDAMRLVHALDMRYAHQAFEITVDMADEDNWSVEALRSAFLCTYRRHYGHADPDGAVEVVNIRTSAVGVTPKPLVRRLAPGAGSVEDAVIARRDAWFDEARVNVAVYERENLPVDVSFEGPALVEEDGATTVVTPGWIARRDRSGNLRLSSTNRE